MDPDINNLSKTNNSPLDIFLTFFIENIMDLITSSNNNYMKIISKVNHKLIS